MQEFFYDENDLGYVLLDRKTYNAGLLVKKSCRIGGLKESKANKKDKILYDDGTNLHQRTKFSNISYYFFLSLAGFYKDNVLESEGLSGFYRLST